MQGGKRPLLSGAGSSLAKPLALLVVLSGFVALSGCVTAAPSPTPVADDTIITELAAKHRAITGWEENLTYTLQAQERLTTGQPILFRGEFDDVFNSDGKTFVRFSSFVFFSSTFTADDFVFQLECSRSIVETILARESSDRIARLVNREYAMVAKIQKVSIDYPSKLIIASGTCIDIAYLPHPSEAEPGKLRSRW